MDNKIYFSLKEILIMIVAIMSVFLLSYYSPVSADSDDTPIIIVKGETILSIEQGKTYVDEGAIAYDYQQGFISQYIIVEGEVNTAIAGTYIIRYIVKDIEGNYAESKTRQVTVIGNNYASELDIFSHSVISVDGIQAKIHFETTDKTQAVVAYGKKGEYNMFTSPEKSFRFDTHIQPLGTIETGVLYNYIILVKNEAGSITYAKGDFTLEKTEIKEATEATETTKTTSTSGGYSVVTDPISERSKVTGQPQGLADASMGNWGGLTPPSQSSNWLKVPIKKNTHLGIGIRNDIMPNATEGWISYDMRLVNWEKGQQSMKLPGPSGGDTLGHGAITNSSTQASYNKAIGGQGGGGAGGNTGGPNNEGKSWSARMMITATNSKYTSKGELGYELYHTNSTNVLSDGRSFGEFEPWRENGTNSSSIRDEKWHAIKHYVKLNDIGKNNGILRGYFDGKLAYERTNIHFTDSPDYRDITLYLNVYHGGSVKATDDFEFYMDNIRYNVGSTDMTE